MSSAGPLRSVGTGCTFEWVSNEAADEVRAILALDPFALPQLAALINLLKLGTVRKGTDYKPIASVQDEPFLYELRLQTTRPQLRLYFIEESHDDGVRSTGLLLVPKPKGTREQQRTAQNQDIAKASSRRPGT